jgi:SAM-dependent methyltransferase
MDEDPIEVNRRWWDERVALHMASPSYEQPDVFDWMLAELGPLAGKNVVHLQCHFGKDTLALLEHGAASVTGLDFSQPAVDAAQEQSVVAGVANRARFVCADVHDSVAAFDGQQFDIVFTGIGALPWFPSVRRWAAVVASLLRPGGFLYLVEIHPVLWPFDMDGTIKFGYLEGEPVRTDEPGSYAVRHAATVNNVEYGWAHGLGEIVTALVDAGLRLDFLHERVEIFYPALDVLVETSDGLWSWPGEGDLPLLFSLKASAT